MGFTLDEGAVYPNINRGVYTPPDQPPPASYTARQLWSSSFRLENDVVNIAAYLSRPKFQADPNFDFDAKKKSSPFYALDPFLFLEAESDAEWDFIEAKLAKEMQDRKLVESAGLAGIATQIAAGVLSPTILLPAGAAATAPSKLSAAGRVAGWAVIGAGAQELPLQLNQTERTGLESALSIGSAAVIGGLLGGAIRYATPEDLVNLTSNMANPQAGTAISQVAPPSAAQPLPVQPLPVTQPQAQGLSAQAVEPEPLMVDPKGLAPGVLGLNDKFGAASAHWLSPITRGITSKLSATRRAVTGQFGAAGLTTKASAEGTAVAPLGDIESRVKTWLGPMVQATQEMNKIYANWLGASGKGNTFFQRKFGRKAYQEFLEEVSRGVFLISQKTKHPMPEINQAAELFVEKVFNPAIKEAGALGMDPFKRMSPEFALRLLTQKPQKVLLSQDEIAAREILMENALNLITKGKYATFSGTEEMRKAAFLEEISEASEIAQYIFHKMTGTPDGHGIFDILKERGEGTYKYAYVDPDKVWSNGRRWGEFLEKDIQKIAGSFTRRMGGDIELYRTFKTTTPHVAESKDFPFWTEYQKERDASLAAAKNDKERTKLAEKWAYDKKEFTDDLTVMVERIQHRHGMPLNPASIGNRLGKRALQLNTMRLMGSVVISALADPARFIMKFGLLNTFRDGLIPMLVDFKNFKMSAKQAQLSGVGIDVLIHDRMNLMADLFDDLNSGSRIGRLFDFGTQKMGVIAGFDYWNQGMKSFAAVLANAQLMRALRAAAEGRPSAKELRFLGDANISQETAKKMWKKISEEGGGTAVGGGDFLPNTEDWVSFTDEAILEKQRELAKRFLEDKKDLENFLKPEPFDAEHFKDRKPGPAAIKAAMDQAFADGSYREMLERASRWETHQKIAKEMFGNVRFADKTKVDPIDVVDAVLRSYNIPTMKKKQVYGGWAKAIKQAIKLPIGTNDVDSLDEAALAPFRQEAWDSLAGPASELQRTYRAAMAKIVDNTIITPGLERPNWVDASTAGRLIAQFRSFTLSSHFKTTYALSQDLRAGNIAEVTNGVMFSLALGMVSYYLWAQSVGGDAKERMLKELDDAINGDEQALGRFADEAIARSGLIGLFAEAQKFAERVPAARDYVTFGDEELSRSPHVNPALEMLGPSIGLLGNMGRIAMTADDPTSETFAKAKQLLPYQNIFYLRQGLDAVNEMLMDQAGVSYR